MMEYKYVYEVYREHSFSKAAKNLYISQPALSATVKKIETRLGFQIFDRSTSSLELTEEGKAYIEAAAKILKIEENLFAYVNDISHMNVGKITVAGTAFFSSFIIPAIVKRYAAQYPAIKIEFIESDSVELYEKAMDNRIDLIVDSGTYNRKAFSAEELFPEHILLAVPKSDPAVRFLKGRALSKEDICQNRHISPQTKGIDLSTVRDKPIILLKKEHDLYRRAIALCGERNFTPKSSIQLNQMMTAMNIASQGLGCVFLSDSMVKYSPAVDLVYFKIDTKDDRLTRRSVFVAYKKNCHMTRAMKIFLSVAAELFRHSLSAPCA